ncbi:MAG TPA: T9SS type A sorting domain-containing protein [Flavobacteriales bacterium]|nr:T9SS type A sorting domain-containing protein [Flavobacteriales bacterium]
MRTTLTLLAAFPFALLAQTNWDVEVGGSLLQPNNLPFYDPMELVINVGDMVTWNNNEGSHNVYAMPDMFPDNPEAFSSGSPAQAPWTFQHTFNIPGVYMYHCTVTFQGQSHSTTQHGMITVLDANGIDEQTPWGELSIYPVPAQDQLNLRVPTSTRLTMEVLKSNGSLQQARSVFLNGIVQVDVSDWNAGLYLVRLMDDNGAQVVRSFVVD